MLLKFVRKRLSWRASAHRASPRPFRYAVLEHASGRRTFVKSYPKNVEAEFARGLALHEIGERTGLYRAPKPMEIVRSVDLIAWEYIEGLREVRDVTIEAAPDDGDALFRKAGRSLAAIHDGLAPLGNGTTCFPLGPIKTGNSRLDQHAEAEIGRRPLRPLHWDFASGNLFLAPENVLVILDAMPNYYVRQTEGPLASCPVYVDVAQMIFSLRCHPGFSRAIKGKGARYSREFLRGYAEESKVDLDLVTVLACTAQLTQMYQDLVDSEPEASRSQSNVERQFRMREKAALIGEALAALDFGR